VTIVAFASDNDGERSRSRPQAWAMVENASVITALMANGEDCDRERG